MFLRGRIGRIELTIHASGGRHRGSHRAAVVAYVLLIFGSSETPVGSLQLLTGKAEAKEKKERKKEGRKESKTEVSEVCWCGVSHRRLTAAAPGWACGVKLSPPADC